MLKYDYSFFIDLFNLSGTHAAIYPYYVENITISDVEKFKIMATFSYVLTNPAAGHQHS